MATKKGVTLTEALEELATVADVGAALLCTYELWHPTLEETIYVVNDVQDFTATKEATADRDPGATVTFVAASLRIVRPEESDGAASPEITVEVGNVSGVFQQALRNARGSIAQWEFIERQYVSTDPSGPAVLPVLALVLTSAEMTEDVLSLKARFADPVNVSVPVLTFRRAEYPTLVR